MSNTYTQLYIQIVFCVRNRDTLINEAIWEELQKYLTGIAQNNRHKMLSVYCMPDYTHVLVGLIPNQSISNLAYDLKTNSSRWFNQQKKCKFHFNWQEGYGAFSYHKSRIHGWNYSRFQSLDSLPINTRLKFLSIIPY